MTDRELLEMAAKAAGFVMPGKDDNDEIGRQYDCHLGLWVKFPWGFEWFRPHIDDSQALRLAVTLRLNVFHTGISAYAMDEEGEFEIREGHEKNPYAATRRAIVRAAAEIGKAMK